MEKWYRHATRRSVTGDTRRACSRCRRREGECACDRNLSRQTIVAVCMLTSVIRFIVLGTLASFALGTAVAQADTGLTFSSCVQSQATALPPCSVNPGVADPTDVGSRATTGITVGITSASANT